MFGSRRFQQALTLLLATWLGLGSAAARMPECSQKHACCKVEQKLGQNDKGTGSCCIPVSQPVAPAPQCQCIDHGTEPANGQARSNETRKALSDKETLNTLDLKSFQATGNVVGVICRPKVDRCFYPVATYRMTLRWRC